MNNAVIKIFIYKCLCFISFGYILRSRITGSYGNSGFPRWHFGKEPACQCRRCKRHGFSPWMGRSLEKETAIHSSTLTWEIPWTEEPGGLQSLGSQRVRYAWAMKHQQTFIQHGPRPGALHLIYEMLFIFSETQLKRRRLSLLHHGGNWSLKKIIKEQARGCGAIQTLTSITHSKDLQTAVTEPR